MIRIMLRQQWSSGSYFLADLTNTCYKPMTRTRRTSSQDWTQGGMKEEAPGESATGGTTHRAFLCAKLGPKTCNLQDTAFHPLLRSQES